MKDPRLYLLHMLECSERTISFSKDGHGFFIKDRKTQDAVIRNFEVIGEIAKRIPETIRIRSSNILWGKVAGFRYGVRHPIKEAA